MNVFRSRLKRVLLASGNVADVYIELLEFAEKFIISELLINSVEIWLEFFDMVAWQDGIISNNRLIEIDRIHTEFFVKYPKKLRTHIETSRSPDFL